MKPPISERQRKLLESVKSKILKPGTISRLQVIHDEECEISPCTCNPDLRLLNQIGEILAFEAGDNNEHED